MGNRVFDVMAINRHNNQEALWRVHGCDDANDAKFATHEYNRRTNAEYILASPAPADGLLEARLHLNAEGKPIPGPPGAPAPGAYGRGSNRDQEATLVDLSPATLRALRAEVWKAVLIAWAIAGTISFVAAFLLVAMRGGA
jgi:hypothetical protein